jgi:hypothetical protein
LRPARADLRHDPRDLLDRTRRGIDVGRPQLRRQQVTSAEDVQRQIAVAVVIAVKEPPFLMPMQRIVRGIEINDDFPGRRLVRLQEQRDKQRLDRRRIVRDLMVTRRHLTAQLQPVERRLAGHRRTIHATCLQLTRQYRHHRIVPQLVVVVKVLVTERNPEYPRPASAQDARQVRAAAGQ